MTNRSVYSSGASACLVICTFLNPLFAAAGPSFLTLPYGDPNIVITEGWIYDDMTPHHGIDYAVGSPSVSFGVLASAAGRAVVVLDGVSNSSGYGNFVFIEHDQTDSSGLRYFTLYAHLQSGSWPSSLTIKTISELRADIANSDYANWLPVGRGDRIGSAGDTGNAYGIHLHFEAERGGYALNKTDPYAIERTADFYPPPTQNCFNVLQFLPYLWTQCPPVHSAVSPVIFSNLIPTDDLRFQPSWGIGFHPPEEPYYRAMSFTPTGNYKLDALVLAVADSGVFFQPPLLPVQLDVTVATEVAPLSFRVLETFHLSSVPVWPLIGVSITSSQHSLLFANQRYWIIIAATVPTQTSADWYLNVQGQQGLVAWHAGSTTPWVSWTATEGAFTVTGTPVTLP